MFENLGWPEILMLLLLGLFVFGPERLPKVIGDAARTLRAVRRMARNATNDLQDELGTDLDIDDLNPRSFVRKHLLSEEDEESLRRPIRDAMRDFSEFEHADEVAKARAGEEVGGRSGGASASSVSENGTEPGAINGAEPGAINGADHGAGDGADGAGDRGEHPMDAAARRNGTPAVTPALRRYDDDAT